MLDVKKSYDSYCKSVKTNKNVMLGVNMMLNSDGILQYSLLQFLAKNAKVGADLELICKVGLDEEFVQLILNECIKNGLVEKKQDKYFITDAGKSVIIASHFKALEDLD